MYLRQLFQRHFPVACLPKIELGEAAVHVEGDASGFLHDTLKLRKAHGASSIPANKTVESMR